jgi:hypothetical protein
MKITDASANNKRRRGNVFTPSSEPPQRSEIVVVLEDA